jgi:uncharacterized protein (TIGR02246 family)
MQEVANASREVSKMKTDSTKAMSVTNELRQTIEAVIARWRDAVTEKNLQAIENMITDDAVFVASTAPPLMGRKAISTHYAGYFEKFNIRDIVEDPHPEMALMKDTVVVCTTDRTVLTPLDGTQPLTLRRQTMTLFREENGSWKTSRGLSCVVADDSALTQLSSTEIQPINNPKSDS